MSNFSRDLNVKIKNELEALLLCCQQNTATAPTSRAPHGAAEASGLFPVPSERGAELRREGWSLTHRGPPLPSQISSSKAGGSQTLGYSQIIGALGNQCGNLARN